MRMNLKQSKVLPTSEARSELSAIISRFRKEGKESTPVLFGSHRKPEGVIISFSMWQDILEQIEDIELEKLARDRISDGSKSPLFDELTKKFNEVWLTAGLLKFITDGYLWLDQLLLRVVQISGILSFPLIWQAKRLG